MVPVLMVLHQGKKPRLERKLNSSSVTAGSVWEVSPSSSRKHAEVFFFRSVRRSTRRWPTRKTSPSVLIFSCLLSCHDLSAFIDRDRIKNGDRADCFGQQRTKFGFWGDRKESCVVCLMMTSGTTCGSCGRGRCSACGERESPPSAQQLTASESQSTLDHDFAFGPPSHSLHQLIVGNRVSSRRLDILPSLETVVGGLELTRLNLSVLHPHLNRPCFGSLSLATSLFDLTKM